MAAFFISKFEGFFTLFLLQDCTGAHYQTARRAARSVEFFGGFCPFFCLPDCTGQPPWWWLRRNPILFDNIIHLLHSDIHCDLDHSRSILHKSVTAFDHFFGTTRLYGGTLPNNKAGGLRISGLLPFFDYQTARGQPPSWWLLFPRRRPIILNIIVHLLHSCIHCDLDHTWTFHTYISPGRQIFPPHFPPQHTFSLSSVGNLTYFQIWRRRRGSHVTGKVVVVLLFLAKSLPPLGYT